MKTIIKYSIEILIPAISAYLASKDNIFIWLAEKGVLDSKFDLNLYQNIFLLINILFTTLYINLKLIVSERKEIQNKKEIEGLYNVIKEFVGNNLSNVCGSDNLVFNIRIFVPEICVWERVKSLLSGNKKEIWFVNHNIQPFAKKDITEKLRFRVEPNKQGLVGEAYDKQYMVFDENLKMTNNTEYSLTNTQIIQTENLLWSICVPILNERNKVISILAFDSDRSLLDIKNNRQELIRITNTLAVMMRDSAPDLFRTEWKVK